MTGRYARHALVPGWSQEALANATVVIAGVGALGNEVARSLAMSGVGRLVLCDPDTVEESNLSRTALFRTQDIGQPKAAVAAATLGRLFPHIQVSERHAPLHAGVGLAELRDTQLVIGCLDSRTARLRLAGRCGLVRAGMLDGGTHPWGGEVRYFRPGGACYGCGLTAAERAVRDDPWSCGDLARRQQAGASGPIAAAVGGWVATTAVRLLCGLDVPDGTVRLDPAAGRAEPVHRPPDPDCPLHDPIDPAAIRPLPLTCDDTAADLRAAIAADESVLTWAEFPVDGAPATIRLSEAPPRARLRDLCVAPREILTVLGPAGAIRYVELAAAPGSGEGTGVPA